MAKKKFDRSKAMKEAWKRRKAEAAKNKPTIVKLSPEILKNMVDVFTRSNETLKELNKIESGWTHVPNPSSGLEEFSRVVGRNTEVAQPTSSTSYTFNKAVDDLTGLNDFAIYLQGRMQNLEGHFLGADMSASALNDKPAPNGILMTIKFLIDNIRGHLSTANDRIQRISESI